MPNRWVVRVVAAAAAVTTAGGSTGAHDGSTAGLGQSLGLDFGQTDITGTTDQSAETDTAMLIRELQRKIAQLRERSSRDGCESTPSPRKQPSTPSKGILSGGLRKALPCTPVPCVPQPCVPGPDEGKEVLDDQAPGPMSRLVTWMFAWATWSVHLCASCFQNCAPTHSHRLVAVQVEFFVGVCPLDRRVLCRRLQRVHG